MPPKQKHSPKPSKKKKRKSATFPDPDPDLSFRQRVEATHYIPKPRLHSITDAYLSRIDWAIRAFTVAAPPADADENFDERDRRISAELNKSVPLSIVPLVVRAVGFNPNERQIKQVECLVRGKKKTVATSETFKTASEPPTPQTLSVHLQRNVSGKEESWIMPEHHANLSNAKSLSETEDAPVADRAKLEAVLLDIMHTGLLVYDPAKVESPEALILYPKRSSTVMEHNNDESMQAVFDVLCKTIGRHTSKDGNRLIGSESLAHLLRSASKNASEEEGPLTKNELDDFILTVEDIGKSIIREDMFMTTAME